MEEEPRLSRQLSRRPTIGVFDSGFGGLTVLKALLEVIPTADYAYFGDTARLPYGSKSVETVARYAVEASHYLESQGAQLLVIACNTATALALDRISSAAHVPVVGVVEPGAEAAASATKNRKIIVIGTEATVSSHAYRKALENKGLHAREKACPLLVPLVEEGWVDHSVTEQVARIYLTEAFADGFHDADTMVLGCTHYPLLKPLLRRVAPAHVSIVDSAESTARAVLAHFKELLPSLDGAQQERRAAPRLKFFATDSTEKFRRLGQRFLRHPIENVEHVDLKE
ncbi:MAG TPA: glutamate racemase [Candidatus Binatia bacterium]|nr:glutamate racemase [Candidatus Binatia bacterium]